MNIEQIRSHFPALERTHEGKPVVYLDGPAGTQVPTAVINAISHALTAGISNHGEPSDSSRFSDSIVDGAREAMADLYNASPSEIAFGQNMTSHTLALSRALAATWAPGDEIVLTRMDHDANVAPWLRAAEDRDVTVRWVEFDDYVFAPDAFDDVLGPRTRLVAVTAASNALGTVTDIPAISQRVRQTDALLFVDAVHAAPHRLIDVKAWDVDFLVSSAYKFYGPHIGILYGKEEHLESLPAYKVRPAPEHGPGRWENGTQSFETLAGVTAAVEYLASLGEGTNRREQLATAYDAIAAHEARLGDRFLAGLAEFDHVQLFGVEHGDRTSTFSIGIDGVSPDAAASQLADRGLFVTHGTYYAVEVMDSLGQEGLVRVGFVHYNTLDEVDALLSALDDLG
ncbi:MAG: cysteine desulfurase-like protein [Acidimicrobiia bacterium]|nr:cysteine desulfurase-like protein [Acidimicrobiia bacterium]